MESQPVRSLIDEARKGRSEAYQQLLALYGARLYGYFLRATGSHHDAEDLLSELMLRLVRNLGRYDDRGKFEPWLFRIAANLLRDRIRRVKASPAPVSLDTPNPMGSTLGEMVPDEGPDPLDRLNVADLSEKVQKALEKLDESSRQMVLLRHFGQMSFKEIAEVFSCPLGTVLAKVHRALKSLRQIMESEHELE